MASIDGLRHVGIYTEDLLKQRDSYTRVIGLQIADDDLDRGMVPLSSDPDFVHHELVLMKGRGAAEETKLVHRFPSKFPLLMT